MVTVSCSFQRQGSVSLQNTPPHTNAHRTLKYPQCVCTPLPLPVPWFQLQTWHCLTVWGTSLQVCTLTLPSSCATLTHTPTSAPDLAMACALLHFTYHVQIIVHIGAVNSNLSLLTCPQRMILLFHYPLLGGNRSKIFFLFSIICSSL